METTFLIFRGGIHHIPPSDNRIIEPCAVIVLPIPLKNVIRLANNYLVSIISTNRITEIIHSAKYK